MSERGGETAREKRGGDDRGGRGHRDGGKSHGRGRGGGGGGGGGGGNRDNQGGGQGPGRLPKEDLAADEAQIAAAEASTSPTLDLTELKKKSVRELAEVARDLGVEGVAALRKQEL